MGDKIEVIEDGITNCVQFGLDLRDRRLQRQEGFKGS